MNDPKQITRYTYLNLDNRPDRRLLARATAYRDGIPNELVHFWTGESKFETWDEIGRHAVEKHGLMNFERLIGETEKTLEESWIGQIYNASLYLKDRITRPDTLEVFLHDDTCAVNSLIGQLHDHIRYLCGRAQYAPKPGYGTLNMMLLNPHYYGPVVSQHYNEPPILYDGHPFDGVLYEGIKGSCDFAIILSAEGAQYLLDLILDNAPWQPIEVRLAHEEWELDGVYTTVYPVIKRYPMQIIGSSVCGYGDETDLTKWNKPDLWL